MRWILSLIVRAVALLALAVAFVMPSVAEAADTTRPSTPTVSSAEGPWDVSDTSVLVRWGASTDEPGGSGLHHYVVNYEDQNFSVPAGTLSYRLTGLGSESDYDVFVWAVDNAGNPSLKLARSYTTLPAGQAPPPSPTPSPVPTATPVPGTPTPTPEPGSTPAPTATPTPTPLPTPTPTPVATTPKPSLTPAPTAASTASPAPKPVATAAPNPTGVPRQSPTTAPAPSPLTGVAFRVASSQVSKSLAKVTFTVRGVPAGSLVTATLTLNGKSVGSIERTASSSRVSARVAVSPGARKALRKRRRVRLGVLITVSQSGTTVASKRVAITLRRTRAK